MFRTTMGMKSMEPRGDMGKPSSLKDFQKVRQETGPRSETIQLLQPLAAPAVAHNRAVTVLAASEGMREGPEKGGCLWADFGPKARSR
ncbi:hypothetical protein Mapa_010941 [Marchantia paleacea]|nr:hypothetical protein Mapa_010941 [Marchantia paleacea]